MNKLTLLCFTLLIGYGLSAQAAIETVRYSQRYLTEGCGDKNGHGDYGDHFMREYPVPQNYYESDHADQAVTLREAGVIREVQYFK